MLKIGVLGAGHLGKVHIKCIGLTENVYDLVGFFDPDEGNAKKVSEQFGLKAFPDAESLMDAADVIDIVSPTSVHFELAAEAIKRGKHVFVEKPLTHTLEEARELIRLRKEYDVKVQVGHVERFNPALLALDDMEVAPMFVEGHRLAVFNPRGTDVSVILDLMIHDLDILLSMVDSPIKEVSANGVAVVSNTPDITNARIVFENGCVANLTASRISIKQMRKLRFFQKDAYVSLDFLDKQAQVVRLYDADSVDPDKAENMMHLDTATGKKLIHINMPAIEPVNAIKMELETFAESIINNTAPRVGIEAGYKALELAHMIIAEVEK
jgi:predicted dehydrogenase